MGDFKIGSFVIKRDFALFMLASALLGITAAVDSTTFTNRLHDTLGFSITQRSLIEIPRELPGLLVVVLVGMTFRLGDVRSAGLANIIGGLGMLAFSFIPSVMSYVVITLVIYSAGQHMYMPLNNTIAASFAQTGAVGRQLGKVQSLNTIALIATSGILFLLYWLIDLPFTVAFVAGALAMIAAGVCFFFMNIHATHKRKSAFVFRKRYARFYFLSVINGARKQLTITFVPWLIIDTFGQKVTTLTILFFVLSLINVFFRPWLGGLIDKKGERYVLMLEASLLFLVCIGLATAKSFFPFYVALGIVSACYILDNLLFAAGMARATYIMKIAQTPEDVTATLSMGTTLDHVVSMFIPLLAGTIWALNGTKGYIYVFAGGAIISIVNFIIASRINTQKFTCGESEAV